MATNYDDSYENLGMTCICYSCIFEVDIEACQHCIRNPVNSCDEDPYEDCYRNKYQF